MDKQSESTVSQLVRIMCLSSAHLNCVKVKLPDRMTVWECLDKSTQAQTQMTDTVMCTKKKKKKMAEAM